MRSTAAVLVAVVSAMVLTSADAVAKSDDGTMTLSEIARCRDRNPAPRRAVDAAPSLVGRALEPDAQIMGRGPLWIFSDSVLRATPGFDVFTGAWRLKFPWLRAKAGHLRVSARRLDGSGTFSLNMSEEAYPATGFLPSSVGFSNGGCWKVTAKLRRTTIRFFMAFSSGPAAICNDLAGQVEDVRAARSLPDNQEYVAKLDAEVEQRDC